ncbi:hypothetical protein EDB84DRAFT_1441454 [Lactarius hengduanensis]|nr:hypothetical protein EDB84DRAFT_1441454 [Lactarius hengduanensis]
MAKEYEEVAKHLFIIVDTASRQVADQHLFAQLSEAIVGRAYDICGGIGDDSDHVSPEAAIVLELRGRDGTTQEVATTIPLAALSGAGDEIVHYTLSSSFPSSCYTKKKSHGPIDTPATYDPFGLNLPPLIDENPTQSPIRPKGNGVSLVAKRHESTAGKGRDDGPMECTGGGR